MQDERYGTREATELPAGARFGRLFPAGASLSWICVPPTAATRPLLAGCFVGCHPSTGRGGRGGGGGGRGGLGFGGRMPQVEEFLFATDSNGDGVVDSAECVASPSRQGDAKIRTRELS